jgi:hypothetical protein
LFGDHKEQEQGQSIGHQGIDGDKQAMLIILIIRFNRIIPKEPHPTINNVFFKE